MTSEGKIPPDTQVSTWVLVAKTDSLREGQTRVVETPTATIALSLYKGSYGAITDTCPHHGASLGMGRIDKYGYLRCPWHDWGFCPHTGAGAIGRPNVKHFQVEQRDDGIYALL